MQIRVASVSGVSYVEVYVKPKTEFEKRFEQYKKDGTPIFTALRTGSRLPKTVIYHAKLDIKRTGSKRTD